MVRTFSRLLATVATPPLRATRPSSAAWPPASSPAGTSASTPSAPAPFAPTLASAPTNAILTRSAGTSRCPIASRPSMAALPIPARSPTSSSSSPATRANTSPVPRSSSTLASPSSAGDRRLHLPRVHAVPRLPARRLLRHACRERRSLRRRLSAAPPHCRRPRPVLYRSRRRQDRLLGQLRHLPGPRRRRRRTCRRAPPPCAGHRLGRLRPARHGLRRQLRPLTRLSPPRRHRRQHPAPRRHWHRLSPV